MVAEDVAYEIENNANQVDFKEVVEPHETKQELPDEPLPIQRMNIKPPPFRYFPN